MAFKPYVKGKPGIQHGFIQFGTRYHEALKLMHVTGPVCARDLAEELDWDVRLASATLGRLIELRLVFDVGRLTHAETGIHTATLYDVRRRSIKPYVPASHVDREAARRGRAKQLRATALAHDPFRRNET